MIETLELPHQKVKQTKKIKRELEYGLLPARERILNKAYTEDDYVLVKLDFTFEETQNTLNKKWLTSMIVQNLT